MDFRKFDTILEEIPKEINEIIYNYYRRFCTKCNMSQHYCMKCDTYNCLCYNRIVCSHCMKQSGISGCEEHLKICICCEKYLCKTCWEEDGYKTE